MVLKSGAAKEAWFFQKHPIIGTIIILVIGAVLFYL